MANEAALHGPHAFPLERLLSIFWQLMRAEADVQLNAMGEQAADIFSQIASLTCLRLLIQVLCLGSPGQQCTATFLTQCLCVCGCYSASGSGCMIWSRYGTDCWGTPAS